MITKLLREIYQVNQGQCDALDNELSLLIENIEQHGPDNVNKKNVASINKLRKRLQRDLSKQHTALTAKNNELFALEGLPDEQLTHVSNDQEVATTATLLRHVNTTLDNYHHALHTINKTADKQQSERQSLFTHCKNQLTELYQDIHVNLMFKAHLRKFSLELNDSDHLEQLLDNSRQLISLLLKDINSEKEASQHFLANLNKALLNVKHIVNDSEELNDNAVAKRRQWNDKLNTNVNNIKQVVIEPNESVEQQVSHELDEIIEAMSHKIKFDNIEHDKLAEQFSNMQKKLSLVELQAQNYKSQLDEQKQLNLQDTLTKLPNRAALNQRFASEFEKAKNYDKALWVAVADIDHFKRINDSFGHNAGDKTLQVISSAISRSLRGSEFIARYGGEEFVFLIPLANKHSVTQILNRVRENIKAIPFKFKQEHVGITISLGATKVRLEDKTPEATFERADQALYDAKDSGRDKVVIK